MIPTPGLLILLGLLAVVALCTSLWPEWSIIWWFAVGLLSGASITDALLALRPTGLVVQRRITGSLSLGLWCSVGLRIHNQGPRILQIELFDHHPSNAESRELPLTLRLDTGEDTHLHYQLRPTRRGDMEFFFTQARIRSALGLWQRNQLFTNHSKTRVYPNFSVISAYLQSAQDNKLPLMGIRKRRIRGEGQDFLQLREYRQGDSLRQIDWKATARIGSLVSREYQEERDQEVIFFIDCGWRMLTQDDELPHFDHSLNAILLLAYVALRQGDAVGLGTFTGEPLWLPPQKGVSTINRILNFVYDLHPSTEIPDYSHAVLHMLRWQKKHALIIVVTSLHDADNSDLIEALSTLKKHHQVMLASLREHALEKVLQDDIKGLSDALRLAATHDYLEHRQRALEQIRANGILSLDVVPKALSAALVNQYLQLKGKAI